jgi:hypothetical protein
MWAVAPKEKKAIPVTGREVPEDCETSRLPHLPDSSLTNGSEVVSLTRRTLLTTPGILISVRG